MTVILPLWIIALVIGLLLTYAVVGLLPTQTKFWNVLIVAVTVFVFAYAINFFVIIIVNIVRDRDMVITQVALLTDFNSDHLCTEARSKDADSVLFLGAPGYWHITRTRHPATA